jgi:hypothetical protein
MNDYDRDQVRRAFSVELSGPPPGAEERVLGGLDYGRGQQRHRWLGVAAAVLAVLVIVTLLDARQVSLERSTPGVVGYPVSSSTTAVPSTCRLPIVRNGAGGFVTVDTDAPAGSGPPASTRALADPAARVRLPDGEAAAGLTYSWPLGRWLPVVPAWVAPDGKRYAYGDRDGVLHVVSAAGQDRAVNRDRTWAVISFQAAGVYAGALGTGTIPNGLWLVDPANGHARQIQAGGYWVSVSAGTAWELTADSQPPPLPPPVPLSQFGQLTGNDVTRLDLRTGRLTPMYASPSVLLAFVGVDAEGDALVSGLPGPDALLVVSGPGRVAVHPAGAWSSSLVDGSRTWLTDSYSASVRLLDAGHDASTVVQVSPGAGGTIQVAGPCR